MPGKTLAQMTRKELLTLIRKRAKTQVAVDLRADAHAELDRRRALQAAFEPHLSPIRERSNFLNDGLGSASDADLTDEVWGYARGDGRTFEEVRSNPERFVVEALKSTEKGPGTNRLWLAHLEPEGQGMP